MLIYKDQLNIERVWCIGYSLAWFESVAKYNAVIADGEEKELIKQRFGTSIPMSSEPISVWYGDTARMILTDLYLNRPLKSVEENKELTVNNDLTPDQFGKAKEILSKMTAKYAGEIDD